MSFLWGDRKLFNCFGPGFHGKRMKIPHYSIIEEIDAVGALQLNRPPSLFHF